MSKSFLREGGLDEDEEVEDLTTEIENLKSEK